MLIVRLRNRPWRRGQVKTPQYFSKNNKSVYLAASKHRAIVADRQLPLSHRSTISGYISKRPFKLSTVCYLTKMSAFLSPQLHTNIFSRGSDLLGQFNINSDRLQSSLFRPHTEFRPGQVYRMLQCSVTSNTLYEGAGGCGLKVLNLDTDKMLGVFRYPSQKLISLSLPLAGVFRNSTWFLRKHRVFGSYQAATLAGKRTKTVRGVAMNPIDHPNGGRTKAKTPFLNKYNKLAKLNK